MAADWRRALLRALGVKATPQNIRFLTNWQRWEGGATANDASFNWLNTTRSTPHAVRNINDIGVKAYDSFAHGIEATAQTLRNGRYGDILGGLSSGNPFKYGVSAGLQTWVSGSPDGNPDYAAKVLGSHVSAGAGRPPVTAMAAPEPVQQGLNPALKIAFSDDPEFLSLLEMIQPPQEAQPSQPAPKGKGKVKGVYELPTSWTPTHMTDGLGWGTKTAVDLFPGGPGTAVGAPEDAMVVYFHPTGAQGGGSMLLRTRSGKEYWIGHIAKGVKAGTHVRRGQRIAVVANQHVSVPHVHIDSRQT